MFTRRSILFLFSVLFIAVMLSGSSRVTADAPTGANNRVYLPHVVVPEPPLSKIMALTYSTYDPFFGGPDEEIYTVRADGSDLTRLTDNDWHDTAPDWSSDGALILWKQYDTASPPAVPDDVWLMNSDGSNARSVNLPGSGWGGWSPVGSNLFIWQHEDQEEALYVTTPTAATPTPVIRGSSLAYIDWSPTGDHLSFVKGSADYIYDLYTTHPDGSHLTPLASDMNRSVSWSPDGAWLAYEKETAGSLNVYISRPDGSETRPVAASAVDEYHSGWVEGGARLLVTRLIDEGNGTNAIDLYSVADGTTSPFITAVPARRFGVRGVSPDGRAVVYSDEFEGYYELKLRAIDSSTSRTISPWFLSFSMTGLLFGGWSDDGRQIAYSYFVMYTPRSSDSTLYAVDLDRADPAYRVLEEGAGNPTWLPQSSWLSAYTGHGSTLRLYNPRTGATRDMPLSHEGARLTLSEWRYVP